MKLVIDINERIVEDAKNGYRRLDEIADAVLKTGIPLPKGHGRLIDVNEYFQGYFHDAREFLDKATTIIEADKGEEE